MAKAKKKQKTTVKKETPPKEKLVDTSSWTGRIEPRTPVASPSPAWKLCNHPPTLVIEGEGFQVYAGRRMDVEDHAHKYPLVLNLTGSSISYKHEIPVASLKKWETYRSTCPSKEIVLCWEDFQPLDLPYPFWAELYAALPSEGGKLLVFCVGGHGRTGTAIACLLVAMGWQASKAMRWVWKNYCKNAIETLSQRNYVYDMQLERDGGKDLYGDIPKRRREPPPPPRYGPGAKSSVVTETVEDEGTEFSCCFDPAINVDKSCEWCKTPFELNELIFYTVEGVLCEDCMDSNTQQDNQFKMDSAGWMSYAAKELAPNSQMMECEDCHGTIQGDEKVYIIDQSFDTVCSKCALKRGK